MILCPLASSSKGNCLFLHINNTKILIDNGICYKQTKEKLEKLNYNINNLDAILITHDHRDHISGLKSLYQYMEIPILCNFETAKGIYKNLEMLFDFKIFYTNETFKFKDLLIHPFSIPHDTLDPVGFKIKYNNISIGICTDIGHVNTNIIKNLANCNYLYVESNHEKTMVFSSNRPSIYKERVLSKQGHLSNEETAYLLSQIINEHTESIYLAHLSEECNSPQLAYIKIKKMLENKKFNKKIQINISKAKETSNFIKINHIN